MYFSNTELWTSLVKERQLRDAFCAVDRSYFVLEGSDPYFDAPQSIGYNATISAPHMHAMALCALSCGNAKRVLDVGCGSGYIAAVLRKFLPEAQVVAIDYIPELVKFAEKNCQKIGINDIIFRTGNGWNGVKDFAPYDAIHVGAAPPEIPDALVEQLGVGGRMVIPVGEVNAVQNFLLVEKSPDGGITQKELSKVSYVPLVNF